MVDMRGMSVTLTEVHREAGAAVSPPTRKVVAAAVVTNPLAGKPLAADLGEATDLASKDPARAAALARQLGGLLRARGALMPTVTRTGPRPVNL